ncbi:hypothetical protein OHR68_09725 [Spirillospora sp. NBC_00431]
MTLDTKVYVLDRISHRDVFVKCNQLISATEATEFRDEQVGASRKDGPASGAPWSLGNKAGQGLCALLDIYYRPDAPLRAKDGDCHWFCDPDCDDAEHDTRACWLEVSFDTAYGYRDEQGRGCGDLHASLVAQLGQWLDERGVRWLWENEFTGEIHSGYDRLIDLCAGGFEAAAWFRTPVLPAIEQQIGGAR